MAAPLGAFVLKNPTVTIDATAYANQLTRARLVPDHNSQTLRTLVPDGVVTDVDTPTWTLELAGVQDWKNGQGLCDKLNDVAGTVIEVVLQPKPGTGEKKATFNIRAHAVEFGGNQGEWALFEAEFGVEGQPVFAEAS